MLRRYIKDGFTTLKESSDRVMATEMSASWRMTRLGPLSIRIDATTNPLCNWYSDDPDALAQQPWDEMFEQNMAQLLSAWSLHYSLSLQQTLYAMATALLHNQPSVAAVRLSLPNKHHFPVDMQPFGLPNDNSTFIAAGHY